jgi:hypothetical protein
VPVEHAETVAALGSPVRIGPQILACAALLTCAHYRSSMSTGQAG